MLKVSLSSELNCDVDSAILEVPTAWQFKYESGLPTTIATTDKAMSIRPSIPVLMRYGRMLSMCRMTVIAQ